MTNEIIDRRREMLFLYDVTDSNPNGDPDNENLPRMDLDGYNIVTDVRLKRTIRDYWLKTKHDNPNMQVLVRREVEEKKGTILTMENLVFDALKETSKTDKGKLLMKIMKELPKIFIDIRCFGATLTVKGANHSFTGPMQFAIGKSLNKPNISTHTITTTFASGEGKGAGAFGAFHIVDYSLLLFHGLLCEQNAKTTEMSENDLQNLYEGLWNGTKLLNTRSKFNHIPRLLLSVVSKEKEFQISGLDKLVSLIDIGKDVKKITDAKIQMKTFVDRLVEYKDNIEKIELVTGDDLQLYSADKKIDDFRKFLIDKGFSVINPLE
ncbi:MAG: type I-B CRISPR-associated protein Cas7/Csh2 [Candidatus Heimdallarchaeota archaeon]